MPLLQLQLARLGRRLFLRRLPQPRTHQVGTEGLVSRLSPSLELLKSSSLARVVIDSLARSNINEETRTLSMILKPFSYSYRRFLFPCHCGIEWVQVHGGGRHRPRPGVLDGRRVPSLVEDAQRRLEHAAAPLVAPRGRVRLLVVGTSSRVVIE